MVRALRRRGSGRASASRLRATRCAVVPPPARPWPRRQPGSSHRTNAPKRPDPTPPSAEASAGASRDAGAHCRVRMQWLAVPRAASGGREGGTDRPARVRADGTRDSRLVRCASRAISSLRRGRLGSTPRRSHAGDRALFGRDPRSPGRWVARVGQQLRPAGRWIGLEEKLRQQAAGPSHTSPAAPRTRWLLVSVRHPPQRAPG